MATIAVSASVSEPVGYGSGSSEFFLDYGATNLSFTAYTGEEYNGIASVQFFDNGQKIGRLQTSPHSNGTYGLYYEYLDHGQHDLGALVTDVIGNQSYVSFETLFVTSFSPGINVEINNTIYREVVRGTNEDDYISFRDAGSDTVLYGLEGNDSLGSLDNGFIIVGGPGDDSIFGQPYSGVLVSYRDTTLGVKIDLRHGYAEGVESGHDYISRYISKAEGGTGDDTIFGGNPGVPGEGQDGESLIGGDGNDYLVAGNHSANLHGDAGDDVLINARGRGLDGLPITEDYDDAAPRYYYSARLEGGSGNDTYIIDFQENWGGASISELNAERMDAGGHDTVVSYSDFSLVGIQGQFEDLQLREDARNGSGNEYANKVTGNNGANTLSGLGGDDQLYGYGSSDNLNGNEGLDRLYGGDGNDKLDGGGWQRSIVRPV